MNPPDMLVPPARGDDWLGLSSSPLPVSAASAWAERPDCGGIVTFTGTAREVLDDKELREEYLAV